jgi:hypothetical protein
LLSWYTAMDCDGVLCTAIASSGFLLDHGIDMTIRDDRWHGTSAGGRGAPRRGRRDPGQWPEEQERRRDTIR